MEDLIQSKSHKIQGLTIHYLEGGDKSAPSFLFLHGASFSAQTWRDLQTLDFFIEQGYHLIALDLPGFGGSEAGPINPQDFLQNTIEALDLDQPIVVSPSMSGEFALPLVAQHPELLKGFVAVAPVGIPRYLPQLHKNPLPTLACWGDEDRVVPESHGDNLCNAMAHANKVILPNAGHACYMTATNDFHYHLLGFAKELTA